MLARHKKELKSYEGEKRAAMKKAKSLRGKKGKEALASLEAEFEENFIILKRKQKQELVGGATEEVNEVPTTKTGDDENAADGQEMVRLRKIEKARCKREAKKDKERQRQEDIEREAAETGPSMRQTELEALETQLKPLSLEIVEIPSDGNCLYRAIAAQCDSNYAKIRGVCADVLSEKKEDYSPFCEYTDAITTFDDYVVSVRSSSEWGGHLELRALSEGLKRPIVVYSAARPKLVMGEEDGGNPVMLSYHLHYYSLGEHYNQVVKKTSPLQAIFDTGIR
mmetsp:Transcript_31398/g.34754  ORF Transcript_31398/g.34754 Transcript_31398/m.34754 type:complete len:281 (+) Transcript_31398:65-907(+)